MLIAQSWISKGFSKNLILKYLQINRSTYYYQVEHEGYIRQQNGGRPIPGYSLNMVGIKVCDEQIKEHIIDLIETEAFGYGYYKITILLKRRYTLVINAKKVYRLCKELRVLHPQRVKKIKYPKRIARNRQITGSNQLWETDLKYGYIHGEDRFFYILSYLDVYDRSIIDYHIGLNCTADAAVFTLSNALKARSIEQSQNLVIRSDNGPQFISNLFEESCNTLGV